MNNIEKRARGSYLEALAELASKGTQRVDDYVAQPAVQEKLKSFGDRFGKHFETKQFTVPEALVFAGQGATIPMHGFMPAIGGSLGGIGALRLYNKTPALQHALRSPLLALLGGSVGGFVAAKHLLD